MKSLHPRALIAATLATALVGMSATALVQASSLQPSAGTGAAGTIQLAQAATPAQPMAPTAEQRDQKRAEHIARMQQKMAERQAAFKTELKLTPEQEPAWNAFVARTQPQARPARDHTREDWSKLTTPQRLDKMQALKAERDAAMARLSQRYGLFYFFAQSCGACEVMSPIVQGVASRWKITVRAISTDGGPSRHFPGYTVETNQRTRMGLEPKITPAVVLWDALKNQPIPIGYGVMSADELQDRIFLLTSKEAGRDY